ncbi:hypothetical protein KIL84_008257 [Mauremys mutica]|uniref:Uncharacterized protein n=1 Tax=Mauremys mutica TaxID=74926 RepID=A0A9D3X9B6_9SAUR|nr:hypothetical protein KIL84_008257 [Mauremys mutica]
MLISKMYWCEEGDLVSGFGCLYAAPRCRIEHLVFYSQVSWIFFSLIQEVLVMGIHDNFPVYGACYLNSNWNTSLVTYFHSPVVSFGGSSQYAEGAMSVCDVCLSPWHWTVIQTHFQGELEMMILFLVRCGGKAESDMHADRRKLCCDSY